MMGSKYLLDKARLVATPSLGCLTKSLVQKGRLMSTAPNVMCYGVPYTYKDCELESVQSYVKKYPLLKEAPTDRLIHVRPEQPYMATEHGNRFMWSAGCIPFMSHKRGKSTSGVFKNESLCVIKPLGILGIKGCPDLPTLSGEDTLLNYAEAGDYMMSLLKEEHGEDVEDVLPRGLNQWLLRLSSKGTAKGIDEEELAFDPIFLPRESKGHLFQDLHMHLIKAPRIKLMTNPETFKALEYEEQIKRVLTGITDVQRQFIKQWPRKIAKNPFLQSWATDNGSAMTRLVRILADLEKAQKQDEEKLATPGKMAQLFVQDGTKKISEIALPVGISVVELHRHAWAHVYERYIKILVDELKQERPTSLAELPYDHRDVLDLLIYEFPEYLPCTLRAIKKYAPELWHEIDIKRRFPLIHPGYAARGRCS
ncbi:unnamed protein product [Urochloa humidicola]